jgi:hypothetical protein
MDTQGTCFVGVPCDHSHKQHPREEASPSPLYWIEGSHHGQAKYLRSSACSPQQHSQLRQSDSLTCSRPFILHLSLIHFRSGSDLIAFTLAKSDIATATTYSIYQASYPSSFLHLARRRRKEHDRVLLDHIAFCSIPAIWAATLSSVSTAHASLQTSTPKPKRKLQ